MAAASSSSSNNKKPVKDNIGSSNNNGKDSSSSKGKEDWSEEQLATFLEEFSLKDRPQGCKDAQLRAKHSIYSCYRNCGKYFKTKKEEKEHYENGKECPNFLHNRSDLDLEFTPTPPLEEIIAKTPVCMDIERVFRMYKKNGIDLPYTYDDDDDE